ncbi:putative Fe-S cluster assembly factor [Babesia sp. Xinjiang]|uniref:putative Fe-S cluster assembly factor n=1 Tax=Babesia sp. Xinjiang TaxID=462227 RepID=UPI000A24FE43|nr:putative Fe-S cluster assembly factor [Babesia sp. Xinjiang]ORM40441.1 putative Fe-S cluster assembly factor [Babesia sp. Xinjiang]
MLVQSLVIYIIKLAICKEYRGTSMAAIGPDTLGFLTQYQNVLSDRAVDYQGTFKIQEYILRKNAINELEVTILSRYKEVNAVLVSTSRFYYNYRHVGNVAAIKTNLHNLGLVPGRQTVSMVPETCLCHPSNTYPGRIYVTKSVDRTSYSGEIENDDANAFLEHMYIAYRSTAVRLHNFRFVMTQRFPKKYPLSSRLAIKYRIELEYTEPQFDLPTHIVYMTGHGGDRYFQFQAKDVIAASDIELYVTEFFVKHPNVHTLMISDTCQASTLFEGLKKDAPIIWVASSSRGISSYSYNANSQLTVSTVGKFTYYVSGFIDAVIRGIKGRSDRATVSRFSLSQLKRHVERHCPEEMPVFHANTRILKDYEGTPEQSVSNTRKAYLGEFLFNYRVAYFNTYNWPLPPQAGKRGTEVFNVKSYEVFKIDGAQIPDVEGARLHVKMGGSGLVILNRKKGPERIIEWILPMCVAAVVLAIVCDPVTVGNPFVWKWNHEENCPWNQNQSLVNTSIRRPCEVRKCAVWKDLKNWFGYTGKSLSKSTFEDVFRDVAHGGSGLYERMAVEGGNLLREASRAFAAKNTEGSQFVHSVTTLVFHRDCQKRSLPLVKQLYIQKEVTIMNETSLLEYFAKSYLSAAQCLTTPRSISNYVRVLLSYSLNQVAGQDFHRESCEWLPTLLQHIYHSQAFRHLQCDSDNLLLRDMYIVFDYQYDYFLPRILECFNNVDDPHQVTGYLLGHEPLLQCGQISGEELLVNFASKYFCELYKVHHGNDRELLASEYAAAQTREFMSSKAVELFACVFMRLHLAFIGEEVNFMKQRSLKECRIIFINLLGACWSISQKDARNTWMANLFQTLRQVQLAIKMSGVNDTGSRVNGDRPASYASGGDATGQQQLDFSVMLNRRCAAMQQEAPFRSGFIDEVLQKALNFFTGSCKSDEPLSEAPDVELPIHVQYDKNTQDAKIHIPLAKMSNMEPVNYRTVLQSRGERIMEIVVSNNGTLPRLDGGVGKSTVAAGLALALKASECSVGICDLDIHGPNIACILGAEDSYVKWKQVKLEEDSIKYDTHVTTSSEVLCDSSALGEYNASSFCGDVCRDTSCTAEEVHTTCLLEPKEVRGIKLMSFSFVKSKQDLGYAAFRGPVVEEIASELLLKTDWGQLDYLILDLPPGTGDVVMSIVEDVALSGLVAVTTPHQLGNKDVLKGVRLFQDNEVPIVCLVENMSYFVCDGCDKRHYLFGSSNAESLAQNFGIPQHICLPMMVCGADFVNDFSSNKDARQKFLDIARVVIKNPATAKPRSNPVKG